jgi:membrane-bound serine protease (ClpP class)
MLRMGLRFFFLGLLVMSVAVGLGGSLIAAGPTTVEILTVDGTIVPVVADYIDRGISQAERNGATVCIIELNTPGSWG